MSQKYSDLIKFTRAVTRRIWRLRGKYECVLVRFNQGKETVILRLETATDFRIRGTYFNGRPILYSTVKGNGEKNGTIQIDLDKVTSIQTCFEEPDKTYTVSHEYNRGEDDQFVGTQYK